MCNRPTYQQLENRIVVLEKEISRQKSTVEMLKESEKRYRLIVDALNEGVILQEASGRIVIWNKKAETIIGITDRKSSDRTSIDRDWPTVELDGSKFSGEDQPSMVTLRTGEPCQDVPMQILKSNGDSQWISINTTPVFDADEAKPQAVLISFTDITERKLAQEALRESEDRFRRLFEEAPVAIQGYAPDGTIQYWNKANEKTYGYSKEEAIGKNLMDLIIPTEMRSVVAEIIRHSAETGEVPPSGELSLWRKDGSRVPVLSAHVAIMRKSKQTELYCLDSDLTEQKRLQTELQQAYKMEAIGTLTGGIAHDFNNILGIIIGNCELALDDVSAWSPAHYNLKAILKAGMRGKDIVRQLLTFCHKTEYRPKAIHLIPAFEDVVRFIRATIPATIDIRHEVLATEDTILSEPTVIYQVLMNLCSNAAQAMEKTGGAIMIQMRNVVFDGDGRDIPQGLKRGKYLQLTVADTGPGINEAVIDRIFDPYYTTKEVGKGTGMGLAVVRGIVESHMGAVSVITKPGNGATFTVYFPLTDEIPSARTEKSKVLELGNETILFIDDEKSIVDVGSQMLTRLGYTVETAMTPLAALDLFQSEPRRFDLVITGMNMPQMTGLQLTRRIKAINPEVSVILCTGFSSYITPEKAEAMGIQGYMMKPIVKLELANLVREVLDKFGSHRCQADFNHAEPPGW